jgi:hypothetical protein
VRLLDSAVQDQSFVSIVVADGAPFVLDGSGPLTVTGANDVARQQSAQDNHRAVLDAVAGARAATPETDLLGAISLGRRTISSATAPRTIVVVDSGLSTVAPLDFTRPGLLDADSQEIVTSLNATGALPELAGYTVVLQGLGDVASPQQPLGEARRKTSWPPGKPFCGPPGRRSKSRRCRCPVSQIPGSRTSGR